MSKTEIFLFLNRVEHSILTTVLWKGKYAITTTSKFLSLSYCTIYPTKSCIQQEEDSFYQKIELKFEEETNKMLHLEHGFVWC